MSYIQRTPDHRYIYDGNTYPGVTSILRVIDKSDALMSWASRQTAEAALAMLPTLPTLLESVGPSGAVAAMTARSSWKKDEAAQLGTTVHALAEAIVRGELAQIPPEAADHVRHYAEWWKASGWKVSTTEAMVVNPEMGYGGTFDLLARDADNRRVLADVKTGRGIYWEGALQLAAYGMAQVIEVGGTIYEMPAIDRYVILHVTREGMREVEVSVGSLERAAFAAALTLSAWRETVKGRKL